MEDMPQYFPSFLASPFCAGVSLCTKYEICVVWCRYVGRMGGPYAKFRGRLFERCVFGDVLATDVVVVVSVVAVTVAAGARRRRAVATGPQVRCSRRQRMTITATDANYRTVPVR